MTTKTCVYQNCFNKSTTATNLTFFSFPLKDEAKCKIWTERAGCPFQPHRIQYICEAHFAHKYISRTPRRTILLPPAVPYWYNNQDKTDDSKISHQSEEVQEEYLNIDSTTTVDDDDTRIVYIEEPRVAVSPEDDPIYIQEPPPEKKPKLIKLPSGVRAVPVKLAKISKQYVRSNELEQQTPATSRADTQQSVIVAKQNKASTEVANAFEANHVIDNISQIPEISTFIYKGEECLQMPKRLYLEQRTQIINELNAYKRCIETIKGELNELFDTTISKLESSVESSINQIQRNS